MFSKLLIDVLLSLTLDITPTISQAQLPNILPQLEYTKKEFANVTSSI